MSGFRAVFTLVQCARRTSLSQLLHLLRGVFSGCVESAGSFFPCLQPFQTVVMSRARTNCRLAFHGVGNLFASSQESPQCAGSSSQWSSQLLQARWRLFADAASRITLKSARSATNGSRSTAPNRPSLETPVFCGGIVAIRAFVGLAPITPRVPGSPAARSDLPTGLEACGAACAGAARQCHARPLGS